MNTFSAAKPGTKCSYASGTVTCTLGSVAVGSTTSVTLPVVATTIGPLSDTVNVTATSGDPDSADLTATATSSVTDPNADLSIALKDSPDPIVLGSGNVSYTMVATNAGPAKATGLRFVNTLPSGFTFVSAKPGKKCSVSGRVVTCTLGNLASGSSTTLTIVATPTSKGTFTDSVTVSSSNPDHDGSDNATSTTTLVN